MDQNNINNKPLISTNSIFCSQCKVWLSYPYGFRFICCPNCKRIQSTNNYAQILCGSCKNSINSLQPNWYFVQCNRCNNLTIRPGMNEYFYSDYSQKSLPKHLQISNKIEKTI